jgi:hypothetical protein
MNFETSLMLIYLGVFCVGVFLCRWNISKERMQAFLVGKWMRVFSAVMWVGALGLAAAPSAQEVWATVIMMSTLPVMVRWVTTEYTTQGSNNVLQKPIPQESGL